jgi:hypothetical protein
MTNEDKPAGRHDQKKRPASTSSSASQPIPVRSSNQKMLYGVIGVMGIIIIAGGAYFAGRTAPPLPSAQTASATAAPSPAASPVPAPAPAQSTNQPAVSQTPLMAWKPLTSGKDPNGMASEEVDPEYMKLSQRTGSGGQILLVASDLTGTGSPAFSCTTWTYQGQNQGSFILESTDFITDLNPDSIAGQTLTQSYKGPKGSNAWGDAAAEFCALGAPSDTSKIKVSQVYVAKSAHTLWTPAELTKRVRSIELSEEPNSDALISKVHF